MTNVESSELNDLLDCPFCGGKAMFYENFYHYWRIKCRRTKTCKIDLEMGFGSKNKKEVAEVWNTRAI